tara:strand:+ start:327 stop:1217 length:891 start_codon:yes stop_codon:yes gene_type:complete
VTGDRVTAEHIAHYRDHGFAVIENFLTAEELRGVREDLRAAVPGWVEYCDDPQAHPCPVDPGSVVGRADVTSFPFAGEHLNAFYLHPELRRFAALNAQTDDLYIEQANVLTKCRGHPRDMDQVMHCDYGNHTLAYPPDLPEYWQTAYLFYFTDVDDDHAPTAVCSWQHYPERLRVPGSFTREKRPELYEKEVKVTVPAGSVLAYSMRTFHRGTPFFADAGRIVGFLTYAPAAWKWLGIVGWSQEAIRPDFRTWIEAATPEERTLFGFPPPGHSYWTEETLEGVGARYPGMNLTPYR